MLTQSPSLSRADDLQSTARPLGVYAKVDVEDATNGFSNNTALLSTTELHGLVRTLYADLLANPAVSGITIGQHWDHIEPYDPTNTPDGSGGYDWSYLDDAFAEANAVNKSVQLIITPGVDSPPWLLNKIPSCDGLFTNSSVATNCGTVTFTNFPEMQHSDGYVLPLPWNPVYKAAWQDFLIHLNARYGFNPAFVSIAVAGPVCGSPEMILPTTANNSTQISGTNADDAWSILITNSFPAISDYRNTDQVFIDQWEQTIEMYEQIFAGVTLCMSPDAGDKFPYTNHNVTIHSDNVLYAMDCLASINSTNKKSDLYEECLPCEAKTEILSYFARVNGPNRKSTRIGGMTASSPGTLLTGDIGIAGVKLLTSLMPPSPPFRGGAEFDHPVSGNQLQQVGCPSTNTNCQPTAVEAAYNILTVFFDQTPAAGFYNGTVGTNNIQYLEVPYVDVEYAEANWCPDTNSLTLGSTSLQDLLNRASDDLFAMAGQQLPLPPPTCHSVEPLAISSQFVFTTNSDGTSVTITSYTGGDGALNIPGTLGGLPVTGIGTNAFSGDAMTAVTMPESLVSIGDGAFAYCFTLTNVSIPDSVTSIGTNCFGGCIQLTAINVDTNNPAYASVDGVLFNRSQTALIQYPGGPGRSYTIPNGVTTIEDAAFDFCQNLKSVTIPNSITNIGNNAFDDCVKLANVTIGSGVITIGAEAFDYCQSLTNITIPNNVSSIGNGAFEQCASLTNVTIGSGVASMGESPFENCGSLAAINVVMGNTVYSSLDGVLFDKSQTTLIEYPAGNLAISFTIPNSVTTISADAFNNTGLTNVTIPNSVISLGPRSFEYCPLTSVIIGSGVTNIGEQEFSGCSSLTGLTIPNSVTSIGFEAFLDCTSLTDVTIPNSVTSIGDGAFEACAGLTNVTIGSGVASIGDSPFEYCGSLAAINVANGNTFYSSLNGVLFDKSQTTLIEYPAGNLATSYKIPKSVITIGDFAFFRCGLTNVTIPNSVTNIGDGTFEDCFSLANVTIGSALVTIGNSAFQYCSSLTSVTIPNSVATIGDEAFLDCTILTNLTIGSGATAIGDDAFANCPLTTAIIPNSVTSMGDEAFVSCLNLTSVYMEGSAPSLGGTNVFANDPNVTVYYLRGTTGWGTNFAGVPTALWTPQILTGNSNFGVQTNQFGFDVTWAEGMSVVVEASTDLVDLVWSPLATNTITGDFFYFSDPQWATFPRRFYRIRSN